MPRSDGARSPRRRTQAANHLRSHRNGPRAKVRCRDAPRRRQRVGVGADGDGHEVAVAGDEVSGQCLLIGPQVHLHGILPLADGAVGAIAWHLRRKRGVQLVYPIRPAYRAGARTRWGRSTRRTAETRDRCADRKDKPTRGPSHFPCGRTRAHSPKRTPLLRGRQCVSGASAKCHRSPRRSVGQRLRPAARSMRSKSWQSREHQTTRSLARPCVAPAAPRLQ